MGTYLSTAEAQTALKEILEVYNNDAGTVDTDRLDNDVDAAEAEVHSGFSRYDIPATSAASIELCRGWTVAILRSKAYSRLASSETPEVVLDEAKAARASITRLHGGRLTLPDETQTTTTGLAVSMSVSANTPQMTRSQLAGF